MPRRNDIHKILVIGSGPIVIGQACEFDYSGTQACKALREEGYEIVLVNSNPATIMTDPGLAQRTYIEPLIPEVVEFPPAEAVRVREILPLFDRIGLEVEEFGERSFRIRAVPALLGTVDGRTLMRDILDAVSAGATPGVEETVQTVIASMACHAAIKAHQPLQPEQMTRLLEDLYRQEVPPTCPHGRPIRVRFRLADLEKLFQRR